MLGKLFVEYTKVAKEETRSILKVISMLADASTALGLHNATAKFDFNVLRAQRMNELHTELLDIADKLTDEAIATLGNTTPIYQ